jgi:hypothetical protein
MSVPDAYDTNIIFQGENLDEIKQTAELEMNTIVTYFKANKLSLNVKKTQSNPLQ